MGIGFFELLVLGVLALAILVTVTIVVIGASRRAAPPGTPCPRCGRIGPPSDRCSFCGAPFDPL